ncbi:trans-resveratrol di-O-methyltransferase-like [Olea europaea var. sylvestris]|uniref:trans-resveratrol di-O-methyltransferase-like n=1 Tax=Olea europaea var. sylvestris TaxID=158386 RepID=UPI000C1D0DA3|nr:trans-resveratrol di-O-methyltransferase-like [Olea europaea var. sylvestris]
MTIIFGDSSKSAKRWLGYKVIDKIPNNYEHRFPVEPFAAKPTIGPRGWGVGVRALERVYIASQCPSTSTKFKQNGEQSTELLHAQAHIWNQIFNFINSMSLKCAIQLGIPDIIHKHGKPMTLPELVDALPIDKAKSQCVSRLMRILTHSRFFIDAKIFENEENMGYWLTSASRLLLKDEPLSVTPFLLAMLDPILTEPWHHLSEWFESDQNPTAFDTKHGRMFWEYAGREPRLNSFFNEAMASDARLVTSVLIRDCKHVFEGLNSIVDVGGGTGTLSKNIADAFPNLKCTVLDLPHVVAGLEGTKNLSYLGGDMFESIPSADAILLKWILHDWSDEECVKILKTCKEAIQSTDKEGKIIIIDMIIDNQKEDNKAIETQLHFDMLMMALLTGRERNEKEFATIFYDAGFTRYKIIPILGLRSVIEVYP